MRQLILRDDTESIVCLTRGHRNNLIEHPKITYYLGDITEVKFPLYQGFTDIIHGANDANDLLQPDQHKYYYTIVEGTARLMKWANADNILILSSGAAVRNTIYGRAKQQCERLSNNAKIARIYAVIGNEAPLDGQFALGKFIAGALKGEVRIYGGTSVRAYLHVEDCARWLIKILHDGGSAYPYAVCGNEPVTMTELAQRIATAFNVPIKRIDGPDREDVYLPETRSCELLGLKQTITLDESIRRIRDYYKHSHPHLEQVA